ncbi:hypothetical protein DRJ54_05385 [Candidatus Acetothermia bacterium]|nr:MAG: hypothetical protein DRJ54_05385 [Candidatus Acetothermia bacterium]
MATTLALLFHRGGEGLVSRARTAAARELARRLVCCHPEVRVAVATPDPTLWDGFPVEVFPDPPGQWRFGERLVQLAERFRPERLLYFSAGSGVLLSPDELARLAALTPGPKPFAVLNNFYSTDFALISPPPPPRVASLSRDNPLGMELYRAGYNCYELPRSAATLFDIDTPGELQLLALHPAPPPELSQYLRTLPTAAAKRIVELLTQVGKDLFVLGRVSGDIARMLDREAACRVRILSEERGMEALGRAARGEVRTLLSSLRESPSGIVAALEEVADGVVWDTRPYLAAQGLWPLPKDRFACDLLDLDGVETPLLRELAQGCLSTSIPFLLGGQSLVSGGLYLACELAWGEGHEVPHRWRPLPVPW